MSLPTARDNSRIDFATRMHRSKNVKLRNMVGGKSRAGGVRRRNHFLYTEPTMEIMPKADAIVRPARSLLAGNATQYTVVKGKQILMVFASFNQASTYALSVGGRVAIN